MLGNRTKRSHLIGASLLSVCALKALVYSDPPAPSDIILILPPAATLPADQASKWESLLERLTNDSFATREKAQQEIETIPAKDRQTLVALRDQTTDGEVKSRLNKRIDEIDDEIVATPPLMTLHLKNAGRIEAVKALSQLAGTSMLSFGDNSIRITLDAVDKSFWEIFQSLLNQEPVQIEEQNQQLRFVFGAERPVRQLAIQGPVAAVPVYITRKRQLTFQNRPNLPQEEITLAYDILIDPRINIAWQRGGPEINRIVDEKGHILLDSTTPQSLLPPGIFESTQHQWFFESSATFPVPPKMGIMIASAKGIMRLVVISQSQTVRINNIEKKVKGPPLQVFGQQLKIDQWIISPQGSSFSFFIDRGNRSWPPDDTLPQTLEILDANNKILWKQLFINNCHGNFLDTYVLPLHLEITQATRSRRLSLPFELKNLPLP